MYGKPITYDFTQIPAFTCSLDFDEDEYKEYLEDNELQNTPESLREYIEEYCEYEVSYLDDNYHTFDSANLNLNAIIDVYGERVGEDVYNQCMDGKEHEFEALMYNDETPTDLSNPDEVNRVAKTYMKVVDEPYGIRGFILTDGTVLDAGAGHEACERIPGINHVSDFTVLGNVRISPSNLELRKAPTQQQVSVISNMIDSCYAGKTVYLDLYDDSNNQYNFEVNDADSEKVLEEINTFYNGGMNYVSPFRNFYENKKKTVIINEGQYRLLTERYNAPDFVMWDGMLFTWGDEDTVPFFILTNGEIKLLRPKMCHKDYIDSFKTYNERRNFVNRIKFQGRLWQNEALVSIWYIDWDYYSENNVIKSIKKITDIYKIPITQIKLCYQDKIYRINKDGERYYLSILEDTKQRVSLSDEERCFIEEKFQKEMEKVKKSIGAISNKNGQTYIRELNDFELLCYTCHQMWISYLRKSEQEITVNQFRSFISEKYNLSFDYLINYYYNVLRNRCGNAENFRDAYAKKNVDIKDDIFKMAESCGIDDTQISIRPYENGEIYSYNITTILKQNAIDLISMAKSEGFIIDRLIERPINRQGTKIYLITFRIRRPATI